MRDVFILCPVPCARLQFDADCVDGILEDQPEPEQPQVRNRGHASVSSDSMELRKLVRTVASEGLCHSLVVFRLADKKPSAKKRPLSAVDDVASTDISIRLYQVHDVHETEELFDAGPEGIQRMTVSFHMSSETPLVRLESLQGDAGNRLSGRLMETMRQWSEDQVQYTFSTNEVRVSCAKHDHASAR